MNKQILLLALFLTGFITACGQQEENNDQVSTQNINESTEDAINSFGALMDDLAGESYAFRAQQTNYVALMHELLLPKAHAASCDRPFFQTCNAGVKQSNYADCEIGFRNHSLEGDIQLNYSEADCQVNSLSESVARTYNYNIIGVRNGSLNISSDNKNDYRGENYGGGAMLTNVGTDQWELVLNGKHKVLTRNGREIRNISLRSIGALEYQGGLARSNRKLTQGTLEINNNLAAFTATYNAQNLEWSSSCCHPVFGSLSLTYTGSISGTAELAITSCGQGEITRNGETESVEFSYCE